MLISRYAAFVRRSDQYSNFEQKDRKQISIQGLASEIGSVVSAIKKEALREGGALNSAVAKAELSEELGDVMWYAFALAEIASPQMPFDLLGADIQNLQEEVGRNDDRGRRIRKVLSPEKAEEFLNSARYFPPMEKRTLNDYQVLAFKTARTDKEVLLLVCSAVLVQLGAELMRHLMPSVEHELNDQLGSRKIEVILGEIAWHISAIASLYELPLDEIAELNVQKNRFRRPDGNPTPLHDNHMPVGERLPRKMRIKIVSIDSKKSQMYWNGETLGDPLKDNSYEPDGYRFHDVMHLANAVHLGWSPVLRKLIDMKRESDEVVDEVEDGGRAAVVEEAIVKVIHSEAARIAELRQPNMIAEDRDLFPDEEGIPFSLLKLVHQLSLGHEAYKNKYWEWENAIRDGYRLFKLFRDHKEGLVTMDLEARTIVFTQLAFKA